MKKKSKLFISLISIFIFTVLVITSPKTFNTTYGKIYFSKRLKNFFDKLYNYNSSLNLSYEENVKWDFNKQKNNTFWHDVIKEYIPAEDYLTNYFGGKKYTGVPGGYIDYISENIIVGINGIGEVFQLKLAERNISKIDSNLNEIYNSQNYKGQFIPYLRGRFGTRDVFIDREKKDIYASIFVDVNGKGCYGMGVYKASYEKIQFNSKDKLKFDKFFQTKSCNTDFNGHASGGRMKKLGDKLILTVGSFDISKTGDVEKLNSSVEEAGKIISIDNKGNTQIISKGHRNQQGLEIVGNKIYSTEHGAKGGDELNHIIKGANYGWPYFSYGSEYDGKDKNRFLKRYRTSHNDKYKKPIFYFTPSLGISELIYYDGEEFDNWKDKLIISSLKNKSLYLLDIDIRNNSIISSEQYYIGNRIRDLIMLPSGKIVCTTDDQKIIYLSAQDNNKYKFSNFYFDLPLDEDN